MKTKSRVKSVQQDGTWNSKHDNALMYSHEYEMEDGEVFQASHKTQLPFAVGDEVEYKINSVNDYGKKASVTKPDMGGYKGKSDDYVKGIEVGHAVNNAVNMLCAGLEFDDVSPNVNLDNRIYLYAQHILKISAKLKSEQ